MLAIIGGSGLSRFADLRNSVSHAVQTPYGIPSSMLTNGVLNGKEVLFLARHGSQHSIPPHLINYRANIWALKSMGATKIVAIATVGGIGQQFSPRTLVVPSQIIDYTWGRIQTFFDGETAVNHVDFTEPFSETLRNELIDSAVGSGLSCISKAVYAVTQGPRLETAAEINRLERDGADIVGMTAMPEAALARELQLPYAVLALVVNHAAGRGDSERGISLSTIDAILHDGMNQITGVLGTLPGASS